MADETEFVRDTALKAGQRIINSYAETAISLFVPELERGLFDDNWRIRYSSVLLLGELLFRVSGVTGKATTESVDEDDNFGSETGLQAVTHSLGRDRRDRVLSGKLKLSNRIFDGSSGGLVFRSLHGSIGYRGNRSTIGVTRLENNHFQYASYTSRNSSYIIHIVTRLSGECKFRQTTSETKRCSSSSSN